MRYNLTVVNRYCAFLLLLFLVVLLVQPGADSPTGSIRLLVVLALIGLSQQLYNTGKPMLKKVATHLTLSCLLLGFVVCPVFMNNKAEGLFLVAFVATMISIAPHLIYLDKRDTTDVCVWVGITTVSAFTAEYLIFRAIDPERYSVFLSLMKRQKMLPIAYLISLFFMQVSLFQYRKVRLIRTTKLTELNSSLEAKLDIIEKQNDVLEQQRAELRELQERLVYKKTALEREVESRTASYVDQFKLLQNYGFLNAKLVRLPIKKLSALNQDSFTANEEAAYDTIQDLDRIIADISQALNQNDYQHLLPLQSDITLKYAAYV
jgi:hypothetical protein